MAEGWTNEYTHIPTTQPCAEGKEEKQSPVDVWLDCDPGHDDAFAIILAGFTKEINLLGISTTGGNQTLDRTTLNALNMLNVCDLGHIPVAAGQRDPLMKLATTVCAEIHGNSGLDMFDKNVSFPSHDLKPVAKKGVLFMAEQMAKNPRPVTIVATGRLTNVALLLMLFPELRKPSQIARIVLMGGAIGRGNISPAAEFNIESDAPAAKFVMEESGVAVVMVPLEVTHTAIVTEEVLAELSGTSPFFTLLRSLLLFFTKTYKELFGFVNGPPLHDPCAVAYVAHPELFTAKLVRVDVETWSPLSVGQTVCDMLAMTQRPPNVTVCTRMDVKGFWKLMLNAIKRAAERCEAAAVFSKD